MTLRPPLRPLWRAAGGALLPVPVSDSHLAVVYSLAAPSGWQWQGLLRRAPASFLLLLSWRLCFPLGPPPPLLGGDRRRRGRVGVPGRHRSTAPVKANSMVLHMTGLLAGMDSLLGNHQGPRDGRSILDQENTWPHCIPRLPLACRPAGCMQRIAYIQLKAGNNTDGEPAWITRWPCPSNADRLLPTLGQAPGSVSAGSGVLQGECISGPGVLKRQVSGYLPLQGHKKLHLPTLGNAGATREAATVSTPHSRGQEGRNRVFPTFPRWGRSIFGLRSRCVPSRQPSSAAGLLGKARFIGRYCCYSPDTSSAHNRPGWSVTLSIRGRYGALMAGRKGCRTPAGQDERSGSLHR